MQSEELLLKEAMEAVEQENLPLARELMTRLLQRNRSNPEYWVLMSGLVETAKERAFCLREAHKLDPSNAIAIHGLRFSGENIPDPEPVPPFDPAKLAWKTSLEQVQVEEKRSVRKKTSPLAWVALGAIAVGIGLAAFFLARGPRYRPDTSPIMKFSLTPPATATKVTTPSPQTTGLAPLWSLLDATYTPTPIYAATPHALTEAYKAAMRAYERQDWPLALEYFQQVLYTEPASPDIHYHIGEIYRFQGLIAEAEKAYDASLKISPGYAPAYLGKGRTLLLATTPQSSKAREQFEKALTLDTSLYEANIELAQLELTAGDAAAALDTLGQIPPSAPPSVQVEILRAQAYLELNEPALALESARAANKFDLTSLPVYKLLAQANQMQGLMEESIAPLETYLAYEPEDPEALAWMAQALLTREDYEGALEFAGKALELDENSQAALLVRGECYLQTAKVDEAAADFNAVLRMDKNSFAANLGIAQIQISRTLYGSAYEYARAAYELGKGDRQKAIAQYWRVKALIGLEEYKAAAAGLEELLQYPEEILPAMLRTDALTVYKQVITPTPTRTPVSQRTKPALTGKTATSSPTRTATPRK